MANQIMQFFKFGHLPDGPYRDASKEVADLADRMDRFIPDSAEKTAGLRKLLEAKDCFVRALLPPDV